MNHALIQLERAAKRHLNRLPRPRDFPRIRMSQPMVGLGDLKAVVNALPKNPVFVSQSIAHRRNLQRGQRVNKTGRQPAQAAVAQTRVRLAFDDVMPIEAWLSAEDFANVMLKVQIDDVVNQAAA